MPFILGNVEHGDSMGNEGIIQAGDVQWMTAGSSIILQEMPKGDEKRLMWGFQLWANLTAAQKMRDPRYRDVKREKIPEISSPNGARIKIIADDINEIKVPVRDMVIDPEYLDIALNPSSKFIHPVKREHKAFAYVIEGKGCFCDETDPFCYEAEGVNYFDIQRDPLVGQETVVLFDEGAQILVSTSDAPIRFLLISSRPLKEPVAWYGTIVMNTRQEVRLAFEEYQKGTFIKHVKF